MDHLQTIKPPWSFVVLAVMALIFWMTIPSRGEETTQPIEHLDALIQEALSKNPDIQSAKQRWEAAKHEIPQTRSLEDPEISITQWAIPSNFDIGNADETWYGIGQSFPFPGKRSLKGQISAKAAEAA